MIQEGFAAMLSSIGKKTHLERQDDRIIIHFDYDCFYASVFEAENPTLRSLPLAVQQKHIIVTCNYEARRRGLHKLQYLGEVKKVCPDVVIVLGEDLTRFRDVSKVLFAFLRAFSWSDQVERLGLDEVFMDISDIVTFNAELLNRHSLEASFFHLDAKDPTIGFPFDASAMSGNTFPTVTRPMIHQETSGEHGLWIRLMLGSHFANHLRHQLTTEKGYMATVGISTNKMLAKLVGNVNKPRSQTTLIPPYASSMTLASSNIATFLDDHPIEKIPGIGFKMAQKLRSLVVSEVPVLGVRPHGIKDCISVRQIRFVPNAGPELMGRVLGGPGSPRGIGTRVWQLLHGIDDSTIGLARSLPIQISIEDSYPRLDRFDLVTHELTALSASLIRRMRIDLTESDDKINSSSPSPRRWLAHPRTLRLSTRACAPPLSTDGASTYHSRASLSTPLPSFVFALREPVEVLAARLVESDLLRLFRRLHLQGEKTGWAVSLLNVGVVGMVPAGEGRDIAKMLMTRRRDGEEEMADRRDKEEKMVNRGDREEEMANREVNEKDRHGKRKAMHEVEDEERAWINEEDERWIDEKDQDEGWAEEKEEDRAQEKYHENETGRGTSPEQEERLRNRNTEKGNDNPPLGGNARSEFLKRKREIDGLESSLPTTISENEHEHENDWDSDEAAADDVMGGKCPACGAHMPSFAMVAHIRFHKQLD